MGSSLSSNDGRDAKPSDEEDDAEQKSSEDSNDADAKSREISIREKFLFAQLDVKKAYEAYYYARRERKTVKKINKTELKQLHMAWQRSKQPRDYRAWHYAQQRPKKATNAQLKVLLMAWERSKQAQREIRSELIASRRPGRR